MHSYENIDNIIIPDYRQRALITDLSVLDLAEDIVANDLIHPIALRAGNPPILVAGGRRLEAIKLINRKGQSYLFAGQPVPPLMIPCVRLAERDELAYLEAEYSENFQRLDLTWQENSLTRAKLHELRLKQTDNQQTISDTARELLEAPNTGDDHANMRRSLTDDIRLANYFDDPTIRNAKSKQEAKKLLELKLRKEMNLERAKTLQSTDSPHRLFLGDATSCLEDLPDATIDVLLTDPPYGIGAHTFGDQTRINHEYDDSETTWSSLMFMLAFEANRVCKPSSHAYVFCDISKWKALAEAFQSYGWKVWPRPFIWYKGNLGTLPRPDHGPRYTYEAILFASKGDRPIIHVGAHDVISLPTSTKPNHAAEKPVELYTNLLERSVNPGDVILDPFCGSGTIFPAATRTACYAIGIELDEATYGLALSRLEEK